ncbi:urea carboxylase [Aspergillus ellipticus CBS 707.79]|uniref:Urea carboxylase n=1 Tax=Aspergillus ellipticus CBS 707.79 TaxID=1448320 RepID=A0A319DK05_9EURO|nr:urea carboxylase [Aspergillus ellipticus CBS 707.79]
MTELDSTDRTGYPLTIEQWQKLQQSAPDPSHLLTLVERARVNASNAWISLSTPDQIQAQWDHITSLRDRGSTLPLFGVPFAVKDNIDASGFYTTAGCPTFATEPATKDSTVVARLKSQGAVLVGKTNLDQFATGLVGTRSPYGAVANALDPNRASGGSSSGSGVVVSQGLVPFSLGTDTAGSGRVPAGFNNVVGLKPTRGALSTHGVLPACRSLDCVSIFALTIDDAELVLRVAEGYDQEDAYSRPRPVIAVCSAPEWFGNTKHATAYTAALDKARRLGWQLQPVDFTSLFTLASMLYEGPWVAERYAAIESFIRSASVEAMDPVVRSIILKAENFTAVNLFKQEYHRQELSREIDQAFGKFDAILVPTTLSFPTMQDLAKEPVIENSRLGTYTNFVNFMDWSALAIPASWRADGLPFSITLIAGPWEEPRLLELSRIWLSDGPRRLGATEVQYQEQKPSPNLSRDSMYLAVVGAHLSGFPLNKDLVGRGATLVAATTTAPCYKLYELAKTLPIYKPGLKRVADGGKPIEVEVWDMPAKEMGSFLETVTAPLGIGSIELEDGSWVKGFICEPEGLWDAKDITSYGGWRAYTQSQAVCNSASDSSPIASTPASSIDERRIKKVLIANRGEIAVRIIRTLREMDISSVTIYSADDARSPHVKEADITLPLNGNTVAETYLDASQILKLALQTGANAVIPGYGFLSENAEFAAAVEAAGLVWVGPTPKQMQDLGLKHCARHRAIAAGLSVVPGGKDLANSIESAVEEANNIGYPVMVKSTAGGGGIGLHRCDDEDALREAFDGVRRLSQANFNDEGVFIEKFIQRARHIEVQVLGDGAGRVLCAGERDCSLQRRNQKVVEETPAAFVSVDTRAEMRRAAAALASSVQYRNVGTVEFIFDIDTQGFYFLEMNTRLDLVRCMIDIAMNNCASLFPLITNDIPVTSTAIEVRVYAESPLQGFRPSSGRVLNVEFPADVRVDTWVSAGQELSSSYDPMIAKIIACGTDRSSVIRKLTGALSNTVITGVETNISYLQHILAWEAFDSGNFTTKSLDMFRYRAAVVEIVDPGSETAVQDFPGREGPIDSYSFRLANRLIGNDDNAAGLECSVRGPTLMFHCETVVAVVGCNAPVFIDGEQSKPRQAVHLRAGQTLAIGTATDGINVPIIMGSRSTFSMGRLGGHNGRNLRSGDLLPLNPTTARAEISTQEAPALPLPSSEDRIWSVAHFTPSGLRQLFSSEWKVHYNSNRLGTGGDAGLHPSNIHDSPYSVGSVSFTGDEAIVLTADGPSLGGFFVFATVMRPGDHAQALARDFSQSISSLMPLPRQALVRTQPLEIFNPIVKEIRETGRYIQCRQAGDRALLLDFGEEDTFSLRHTFHIMNFIERHHNSPIPSVKELTPGVRSLHVRLETGFSLPEILNSLVEHEMSLGIKLCSRLPSRVVHMPLVFDDKRSQSAIARYASTIRPSAPYLPSNIEFLKELNGLESHDDIAQNLYNGAFLVLGLGDVYQGSPCAVPLDPRHRLFGTKYNPSRSLTPRGAVGIAGQYLCIYATDSPGGYQLVGRTVPIWDESHMIQSDRKPTQRPWLLSLLDQVKFYPAEEADLALAERNGTSNNMIKISQTELDLDKYENWLKQESEEIEGVRDKRSKAVYQAKFFGELLKPYDAAAMRAARFQNNQDKIPGERVKALLPGRCFRHSVEEGDEVKSGDPLGIWIESNKMEVNICAPRSGNGVKLLVQPGDVLEPDDDVAIIQ